MSCWPEQRSCWLAQLRGPAARYVIAAALIVVLGTPTGLFPETFAVVTLPIAAMPAAHVGGLLRLVRDEGVSVQAVTGGLAIYLIAGLLFAFLISFVAHVQSGPYFTQGAQVSGGDRVYYSFTVLTTTACGDYTAATGAGHALAVLEMLIGQLYLVTVTGLLVGNYVGRRRGEQTSYAGADRCSSYGYSDRRRRWAKSLTTWRRSPGPVT
jgi:hypothetical protein